MQYCSLQHWTSIPSPVTSTTGGCFCFGSIFSLFLELFLHSSPVYLQTWGVHLSVSCLSPFHTVHGVLKARILKWFSIPLSRIPHFVRTLHHDPPILGGPTCMAHSFIELDNAMIYVVSLVGFLWLIKPRSHIYLPTRRKTQI